MTLYHQYKCQEDKATITNWNETEIKYWKSLSIKRKQL